MASSKSNLSRKNGTRYVIKKLDSHHCIVGLKMIDNSHTIPNAMDGKMKKKTKIPFGRFEHEKCAHLHAGHCPIPLDYVLSLGRLYLYSTFPFPAIQHYGNWLKIMLLEKVFLFWLCLEIIIQCIICRKSFLMWAPKWIFSVGNKIKENELNEMVIECIRFHQAEVEFDFSINSIKEWLNGFHCCRFGTSDSEIKSNHWWKEYSWFQMSERERRMEK